MATTQQDIRQWLTQGKAQGAAYMLVVCDTYDWEDYPVYVKSKKDLDKEARSHHNTNMQKVMECYDLSQDLELQLNEGRAWNGWKP